MATRGPTDTPAIEALLLSQAAGLGMKVDVAVDVDVECDLG